MVFNAREASKFKIREVFSKMKFPISQKLILETF